jgi:uncharacterized protein
VLIAFSGGADSTLVAYIASKVSKNSFAVTVDNGVMPLDCIGNAEKIAKAIGIKHAVVMDDYMQDESFRSNPPNRCYICKNKMYMRLLSIADEKNLDVMDGTNITDLLEDRPGIMVNYGKNIKSPLIKFGFTTEDVKKALEILKIDYSKSTTCIATRISKNSEITSKKINRINYAESLLKGLSGSDHVRVRDQNGVAIIEVGNANKILNTGILSHIDSELKAVGFNRVTLDIGSYGNSKKDLMVYKPCKDEKNKIMFETVLPYSIDIEKTCQQMKSLGEVKCSEEMGIIMVEILKSNVTIFKSGKIVARRVVDREDAEDLLVQVLPNIRRII